MICCTVAPIFVTHSVFQAAVVFYAADLGHCGRTDGIYSGVGAGKSVQGQSPTLNI